MFGSRERVERYERMGARITGWSERRWPRPTVGLGSVLVLLVAAGVLLPVSSGPGETGTHVQARNDVNILRAAVRAYQMDHGRLPDGPNPAIIRTLLGDNPRRVVYLELRPKQLDPAGVMVDPWGSPYRFDLSYPDQPRIHSPGKNRRDEPDAPESDDVCSWR